MVSSGAMPINASTKIRYGICMLTVTGEKLFSDTAAVTPFIEKQKVDELNLSGAY